MQICQKRHMSLKSFFRKVTYIFEQWHFCENRPAKETYIHRLLCCVAACCSVLQCVAECCSVMQCVAVCCRVLQWVVVCCSVLQWVVLCCSVLQCVAVCCSVLQCAAVCCSVLQCAAVCCSVLQWVKRSIPAHFPERHSTQPHMRVRCSVLQCITVSKEIYARWLFRTPQYTAPFACALQRVAVCRSE